MAKRTRKRAKRKKPTPQELEARTHRKDIREIFRNSGFEKVIGVSDKEIEFDGRTGDFDDIFIYENIIVLSEYTISQKPGKHLNLKKILFDKVLKKTDQFIDYLESEFETFKQQRNQKYTSDQCNLIIMYCSKYPVDKQHKQLQPEVVFLDYPILKYFLSLSKAVSLSSKYELYDFLDIEHQYIGENYLKNRDAPVRVNGSVLPEHYSKLDKGFKLVTFYIEPDVLLRTSYVLRKQGWRDKNGLYQRMISSRKIKSIRKYLLSSRRVFINNIIATLSTNARIVDEDQNTVNLKELKRPEPVVIEFPDKYNSIGLIDGQHRVFAYFESKKEEEELIISALRKQTNLLVTAIIFPRNISQRERLRFEAKLFMEINTNQTNASTDLKQSIQLILNPFSTDSIARAVISRLDSIGPLEDLIQNHFYETKKLKPTSIVSYGLKPIVKLSGDDSFYSLWENPSKEKIKSEDNEELLDEYIDFCRQEINLFLSAVKKQLSNESWNTKKNNEKGLLSTVFINACIICLRFIIRDNKKTFKFDYYNRKLEGIRRFRFGNYGGSQYTMMGTDIYNKYFKR